MEDFKQIAETIRANSKTEVVLVDGKPVAFSKARESSLESIKPYIDQLKLVPDRRNGTAVITEVSSFINHVNLYQLPESALFASYKLDGNNLNAKIQVIYDYNERTYTEGIEATAAMMRHRAEYNFPLSNQLKAWMSKNGTFMSQEDICYFIEDNIYDIVHPTEEDQIFISDLKPTMGDTIEVLEMARALRVNISEDFEDVIDEKNGLRSVKFTRNAVGRKADGNIATVPNFFVIRIPLFNGSEAVRILVRIKFKKTSDGNKVSWMYELYRLDRFLEASFKETCEKICAETMLPMFYGTPEDVKIS